MMDARITYCVSFALISFSGLFQNNTINNIKAFLDMANIYNWFFYVNFLVSIEQENIEKHIVVFCPLCRDALHCSRNKYFISSNNIADLRNYIINWKYITRVFHDLYRNWNSPRQFMLFFAQFLLHTVVCWN